MQIIGRTYADAEVFQAGVAYETAIGGWYAKTRARPDL
jgi:amidase